MKKKENEVIEFPDSYYVIGADLSLNRPGFALIHIVSNSINEVHVSSVDNKSKPTKKTRGEILVEISEEIKRLLNSSDHVYLIREASINNACFGRRSGTAARTGISEVVGITDYIAWIEKKQSWFELYPVSIKKLVTGNGKATKEEVADKLKDYVGNIDYSNDDESDATAVAIAWLIKEKQIKSLADDAADKAA